MREPAAILEEACAALAAGTAESCHAALERFRARVQERQPDEDQLAACERQLRRLRALAEAASEGLDHARAWMRDLSAVLGGLDVYDRGGRQRVTTDLASQARRF